MTPPPMAARDAGDAISAEAAPGRPAPGGALRAWWLRNRRPLSEAFFTYLTMRVLLTLVAMLAAGLLPMQIGQHATYHRTDNVWLDVWVRWDSEYYLDIAASGYAGHPQRWPFFPLYPLLIAGLSPLVGSDIVAALVVSNACCFLALFYLYRLARAEWGTACAARATLYLSVFPTALFLLAAYTESLYLATSVAAFYYARQGRWLPAAVAALAAGLTRSPGLLLTLPLAYEAVRQARAGGRLTAASALAILGAPAGWVSFAAYLGVQSRDPLALLHASSHGAFSRHMELPWNTLRLAVQNLADPALSPLSRAVNNMDLIAALLLIAACLACWWELPRAYALYATASVLLLLGSTVPYWPLQSIQRYSLAIFPLYLLLARLGARRRWHQTIMATGGLLLGMYTALFAAWYWVF